MTRAASQKPGAGLPAVLAASFGRRYSGINASMLAVIPAQRALGQAVAGVGFHLPESVPRVPLGELRGLADGVPRVWHARRNIDMALGLLLRGIPGVRLKLLFTSAALRRHSRFTRALYRRMDAVIATTEKAASFLERAATVVRHGVDPVRFSPSPDRSREWSELGVGGERGLVAFGRLRPNKGSADFAEALLRVLPENPGWCAAFVGEATGEHRGFESEIRGRIARAGLSERVAFSGFVPNDALPKWYRAASLVVCASREEGFGLPCLEAFASGTPVVATDAGAWPELVEPGLTGRLVPGGQPAALAEALGALMADREGLERMGVAARERAVGRFSVEREAEAIGEVYRRLLGGR